ncbi:MAG: hypothetical protein LC624_06650 [Halobacteriales archaeon]|nr:hypothetical protein [Halobacteriales archaeon]
MRWRFLADAGAMLGLSALLLEGWMEPVEAVLLLGLTVLAAPSLLLSDHAKAR